MLSFSDSIGNPIYEMISIIVSSKVDLIVTVNKKNRTIRIEHIELS